MQREPAAEVVDAEHGGCFLDDRDGVAQRDVAVVMARVGGIDASRCQQCVRVASEVGDEGANRSGRTPTAEEFNDPANEDFAAGPSWYLGEMLVRGAPSSWIYLNYNSQVHVGLADEGDSTLVCYEVQTADDVHSTSPVKLFRLGLSTGLPKPRSYYDDWCEFCG